MKAEEYLTMLTEQMRCKKARGSVEREIQSHIEDQKISFMSDGMEAEDAEEAAVQEMGDPIEVGISMDRIHRPKMAWGMIALVGVLSVFGYAVQYLMQANLNDAEILSHNRPFYIGCIVVGFAIMMGVCFIDYSKIGRWAKELMIILFIVLFASWLYLGVKVMGARAWIALGSISLSINMLLYLFIPLYGGVIYRYRGQGYWALMKCVFWMIPPILLAVITPSITTAGILFVTFAVTLSVAVCKNWFRVSRKITLSVMWLCIVLLPAATILFVYVNGALYQVARIQAYMNPSSRTEINVIRKLLADSRFIGGSAGSIQAGEGLYAGSDYLLVHLVSYYGILAAIVITGLLVFLFQRFLKISLGQKNQMGMLMGVGCSVMFSVQVMVYILVNTGFFVSGGYCPFFTYGGTGVIVTYVLLGILLSIYRYQNVVTDIPVEHAKMPQS